MKNYNVINNGKNLYDQPIDSDIKPYKEIRKLTIGQGEDYTTRYFWIMNNHNRLIALDLSRHKKLDADPKVIKQIEFAGQ